MDELVLNLLRLPLAKERMRWLPEFHEVGWASLIGRPVWSRRELDCAWTVPVIAISPPIFFYLRSSTQTCNLSRGFRRKPCFPLWNWEPLEGNNWCSLGILAQHLAFSFPEDFYRECIKLVNNNLHSIDPSM